MPRPKSILQRIKVDCAGKAHNCQHNPSHRILMGEKRLKVTKDRSDEHYCIACAVEIIDRDIQKLTEMRTELLAK